MPWLTCPICGREVYHKVAQRIPGCSGPCKKVWCWLERKKITEIDAKGHKPKFESIGETKRPYVI